MNDQTSKQYAVHITELTQKARTVIRDLDPNVGINIHHSSNIHIIYIYIYIFFYMNDLTFLRINHKNMR